MIQTLLHGQISSLLLAAGVIGLIMLLVLRSIRIGLLSLIPNTFPLVINFGIMGLFDIPLDTGTSLIAVVALGIAVDDTIHYLSEYKNERDRGVSRALAIKHAHQFKGKAIISSSLILTLSFSVLLLSNFVPTMHFGLLCSIVMIAAMIGDLVFLPALMLWRRGDTVPE